MTDYTKNKEFSSLTGQVITGSQFDEEFDEIETAIASKEDEANKGAANGYAGLDASGLVAAADLPAATDSAQGAVELATDAETLTGTDTARAITPANLTAKLAANAGMLGDVYALTDPGADTLLGWDDSAGAVINFTVGTGLTTTAGGALTTNDSAIVHDSLSGFVANEHIDHSGVTLTAGAGLSGGGTIAASRTFAIDWTELTEYTINDLDDGDLFCVYDSSAASHKKISYEHLGLPIVSGTAAVTPADTDTNKAYVLTGTTDRAFTLNTGVGELGNIFVLVQADTASWQIAGTSTVTHAMAGLFTRTAGSVIVLLKIGADEWVAYGDGAAS